MERKTERKRICERKSCRNEFRSLKAHSVLGKWGMGNSSISVGNGSADPIKQAPLGGGKPNLAWRQIAGAELDPVSFRLATLPDASAAQTARANRSFANDDRRTLIKRHHPPVNMVGGYRFRDAPLVELTEAS